MFANIKNENDLQIILYISKNYFSMDKKTVKFGKDEIQLFQSTEPSNLLETQSDQCQVISTINSDDDDDDEFIGFPVMQSDAPTFYIRNDFLKIMTESHWFLDSKKYDFQGELNFDMNGNCLEKFLIVVKQIISHYPQLRNRYKNKCFISHCFDDDELAFNLFNTKKFFSYGPHIKVGRNKQTPNIILEFQIIHRIFKDNFQREKVRYFIVCESKNINFQKSIWFEECYFYNTESENIFINQTKNQKYFVELFN
jgi:hypothetical protein